VVRVKAPEVIQDQEMECLRKGLKLDLRLSIQISLLLKEEKNRV
jgi:hypothetical protein